ncbi:UPF0676 protein C1494.01-like [Mizuhopecten yessoensis]|uniref:UPF0676 protein C1494.01-like n=1 Tax=Mizuhopecten yessoensis TaxID=6573 RepID=UPI000B45EA51|nr:UPF0676 protein C1494.01-like [Mizuhopecten yessoensis]
MVTVPVVDISAYGLDVVNAKEVDTETVRPVADSLCGALRDIGFCYIKNHGISQSLINQVTAVSRTFFEKPLEYKNTYRRQHISEIHGWIPRETETLNPDRPCDYKEAYNYTPIDGVECPSFEVTMKNVRAACHQLSHRILDLMSIGLDLEDKHFLRNCHQTIGQKSNTSTLRTIFYPSLLSDEEIKPNQIRCGEHSDFGSLTLLFQDDVGGLQVCNLQGEYVPASPIPGTILINIGDLMQRWTSDKLIATKHRVVIPDEEIRKTKSRQSVAFFVVPDNDVVISCLDKSDKYEPISSVRYIQERLSPTY